MAKGIPPIGGQIQRQIQEIFGAITTPRYVILMTDETQTRVYKAREVSLSEMIAILEANGLLTNGVADMRGTGPQSA